MPDLGENFCGYVVKALSIAFGIIGMIFSGRAAATCEFVTFKTSDFLVLDAITRGERPDFVFGTAESARVGIWVYEVTSGSNIQGCLSYPERYFTGDVYDSIAIAQLCTTLAYVFGTCAVITALLEFCICSYKRSRIVGGLFWFFAMCSQMGTFALVADPVLCREDDVECWVGEGLYLSVAAVIFYFIACSLACGAPHSDPCYENFKLERERRQSNNVKYATPVTVVQQKTVVQPPPAGRTSRRQEKFDEFGNRVV